MRHTSLIALLFAVGWIHVHAQGCSDAGACGIGASQTDIIARDTASHKYEFTLGQTFGLGEQSTQIHTTQLGLTLFFGEHWQAQLRLPYQVAVGDLATAHGIGDLQIAGIAKVLSRETAKATGHQVWLSVGAKIPPNGGDLRGKDSLELPMVYQPTLGAFDVIPAVRWAWRGVSLSLAYQAVLSTNTNQFTSGNGPDRLDENFHSRELKRGNDIVMQANYRWAFLKNKQMHITPGVLWIYKHHPDEVRLANSDLRVDVPGSRGTTLNLTLHAGYRLNPRWRIDAQFGAPVITRDYRTDGLTRTFVAGLRGSVRF